MINNEQLDVIYIDLYGDRIHNIYDIKYFGKLCKKSYLGKARGSNISNFKISIEENRYVVIGTRV